MDMTTWTLDERESEFLERLARLMEEDGGPRTGGRMLGLMLLSPGEMGLDEIAERLQVSKASVSTNARMLEQFGVLERVGHPGDRRDFYRVAPDAMTRVLERRVAWLRRFGEVVEDAATTRAAQEPVVRSRFSELCRVQRRAMRNAERVLRLFRRGGR
ncbi:MAG TPA: MarR family transcriptional regulator [Longimicrobium sp.]|nr:MarR family transcriptional regulator [Longimicrobium sp.]